MVGPIITYAADTKIITEKKAEKLKIIEGRIVSTIIWDQTG